MTECRTCGRAAADDERFCAQCGHRLGEPEPEPERGPGAAAAGPASPGSSWRSPGSAFPHIPDLTAEEWTGWPDEPDGPSAPRPAPPAAAPPAAAPPVATPGAEPAPWTPPRPHSHAVPPPARPLARRPRPAVSVAIGVALAAAALLVAVLANRDEPASPPATTVDPATDESAAEAGTSPSGQAAPCVDPAAVADAQSRSADFGVVAPVPPAGTPVVLQFATPADTALVITVCRQPGGPYWYFARGETRPLLGLLTPAESVGGAIVTRVSYTGGQVTYTVDGSGVTVTQPSGAAETLPPTPLLCAEPNELPAEMASSLPDAPPCGPDTVRAWAP